MPSAKWAAVSALAALAVAGCGTIDVKPSSVHANGQPASRGRVDDPATNKPDHVACLRAHGQTVQVKSLTDLVVDGSIRVHFTPTPGSAQDAQIQNREEGAEVIGSALLYPGQAPDATLQVVEGCIAQGVKG